MNVYVFYAFSWSPQRRGGAPRSATLFDLFLYREVSLTDDLFYPQAGVCVCARVSPWTDREVFIFYCYINPDVWI